MGTCGCSKKQINATQQCPLCKEEAKYIYYLAVRPIVKENLQRLVQKDNYFICRNSQCDVVFFNQDENIIFLTQDINMAADFHEVSKPKSQSCKEGCKGCNSSKG
ncbi:hypothetical protein [Natronincola ferrireducens]|uniref:CopZ zinc binding domain-containing protein n=1 Tax=Natronincola ferrireducens TaxID=393762 RepID=A0A1G8YNW0_9FIRM|nr:hypothetical protein [Natronincola ferrireducens]SDK04134.1 hypothetical protein SAMN05660472_00592 [Natronincola ferrireducens]